MWQFDCQQQHNSVISAENCNCAITNMISDAVKLEIVKFIRERAPTLFGPLSATVTNESRRKAWIEVWNYCKELGQFVQAATNAAKKKGGAGHEWEYIHAGVWGQWAAAVRVSFHCHI